MPGTLGGLIVTLGLDAAQYFAGLTKSEQQAKNFSRNIERTLARGVTLAASGFTVLEGAVLGAAYAVDRLVKQAANFKDLEEKTGANAQALASFSVAAEVAGSNAEDLAAGMNKMAKNLSGVDDESKAAGAALAALNIPINDFKKLAPEDQIETLAKAFERFADGPEKSAAAMALLGKSGANLLPFFKELASGTGRVNILTQAQIELADQYADAQAREIGVLRQYLQVLAIEIAPALTDVVKIAKEYILALAGVATGVDDLATRDRKLAEFGKEFAERLRTAFGWAIKIAGFIAQAIAGVDVIIAAGSSPKAKLTGTLGYTPEQAAAGNKAFDDAVARLRKIQAANQQAEEALAAGIAGPGGAGTLFSDRAFQAAEDAKKKKRPTLGFSGAQGRDKEAQEAKRILDTRLKEQERFIKNEQDLLKDREHYLQGRYEDELIGFREYFAERQRIAAEAQTKILDAQDRQIELARGFATRPGLKEDERLAAEEKLNALIDERASTERAYAQQASDNTRAANRALREYTDSVNELNAQMLDLAGNTSEAAAIRFDRQNRSLLNSFRTEGNTEGERQLAVQRQQVIAREDLGKAAQKYSLLLGDVQLAEARIALEQQSGATTSLEALNKRAALAREYVVLLEAQAAAAQTAALAMAPGPEQDSALQNVRRLRLEIEQLAESARELENTFRKTFEDAFANSLVSVIDGTKSVSEAIKDMERQIVASISRIASQNIGEALFGKSGPMGSGGFDIAGLLAKAFGGGGGGGWTSGFDLPMGFAAGGSVSANRPVLVGERGPELFQPRAAGNIVPNSELMSRRAQRQGDINISINVDGSTSRATADQIAVRTGRAVRRAMNRNA